MEHVREELERLITKGGYGYAAVSRLLGRNPSYIQQFIKRGSPRILDPEDRKTLASFLVSMNKGSVALIKHQWTE